MKPTLGRLIALLAVAALTGVGCGDDGPDSSGDDRIHVVAAFYPLVFAAESVGGDLIEIENLTPPGVEPHDLELSANQVRSLTDADLVLYLGQGFQPAVEDAISGSDESRTLDALEGQNLAPNPDDEEEGPPIDPHVWLDPTLMAEIVDRVTDKLSEIDPDNADTYEENAADVDARLTALDEDFSAGLSD